MSRSSYDDMPDSRMNNRYSGNRGKTGLIAIAGILIALLCIILFLIFTPSDNAVKEEEIPVRAAENAEESMPEIHIPEPVIEVEEKPIVKEDKGEIAWNSYIWKSGDDIKSVAEDFGLSPDTLILINDISDISNIKAGKELRVPSIDGRVYIVNEGDTFDSVLSKLNPLLSEKELKEINGIDELKAGEELFIPTQRESDESSSFSFSLPINGSKIISFGEYYEGYKIDGVVYSAKAGTPVMAALNGFVVDAGINPVYGKFISIMHDGGYKTSYYALESVDVVTGENVEKGRIIGSIGSSNTYFKTPALLFKVEQSGIKINPELVIK